MSGLKFKANPSSVIVSILLLKLKPEELWFSTLASESFRRELKLGEKVSIETADDSVWQHCVQLAQAEQDVQKQVCMFIYAFSMCTC